MEPPKPVKLEESLFDEDLIDGFSFISFDDYKGVVVSSYLAIT